MSALRNVAQGFRNLWGAADEYDDVEEHDSAQNSAESRSESRSESQSESRPEASRFGDNGPESSDRDENRASRGDRYEKFTTPTNSSSSSNPNYGANSSYGGEGGARRLRSVSIPLRAAREKNIYTLRPKSLEESCVAADYLKTGCAVVLNLESVEQTIAIRVIDFMSGVCYGLEHQGHAMKLGDKIFLFTPGDFEISSDEIDYAENRDLIFKDVAAQPALGAPTPVSAPAPNPERRSWER